MKLNSTKIILSLCLSMAAIFSVNSATSQVVVNVIIQGTAFASQDITINVGDTVTWTNSTGISHNVNGTTATFSSNPASFGNAIANSFTYTFVFDVAGNYDYRCDVHFGSGMTGTVTVQDSTASLSENALISEVVTSVYPNPVTDFVVVELASDFVNDNGDINIQVYDMTGKLIRKIENVTEKSVKIDTKAWPNSVYFIHVLNGTEVLAKNKVSK
jgi:plastocyanin